MLRDSIDRRSCDSRLLVALLATTGLLSSVACSNSDVDPEEADVETDVAAVAPGTPGGPTPNGLTVPAAIEDWLPIGAVARPDRGGELRVIVGNPTAVTAARAGQTNPWPEGTMLSHFVWAADRNEEDPSGATINPAAFKMITLMVKNTAMYADDGGWAYGAWMGEDLTPPAAGFDRDCVNCHTERVADKDYVFTIPGQLPDPATIASAPDALNGVEFPSRILDWRVIGVADVVSAMNPTLRVLVGNPTAVDAARAGQTNPWPDGSMISHYNWAAGTNEDTGDFVAPGAFNAFTLMQRSGARYEADGDWAYGVWRGMALEPLPDPAFDRACVGCHTDNVSDRDMVFNNVGQLPPALLAAPASTVSR